MARNKLVILLFVAIIPFLTSACGQGQGEDYFTKADAYFEKGRFEKAVQTYEKYLNNFPAGQLRDKALFRIGEILYYALGDRAAAVGSFSQLVAQHPASDYSYRAREIMAGVFRDETNQYQQATIEYKWLISQRPDSVQAPDFQFKAAECYLLAGDYQNAILEFGRLLEAYPNSELVERAIDELGSTYLIMDHPDTALFILTSFIRRFPSSPLRPAVEFKIGTALEETYRYDEALKIYHHLLNTYKNTKAVEIRIAGVEERRKLRMGEVSKVDYDYRPDITEEVMRNFKEEGK
jgi:TolA-binding protein